MEIKIEDTDLERYVRGYVDQRIEDQIKQFLQYQLRGVIEARLAALRLTDPESPMLDSIISDKLGDMIDARIHETLSTLVSKPVRDEARLHTQCEVNEIQQFGVSHETARIHRKEPLQLGLGSLGQRT